MVWVVVDEVDDDFVVDVWNYLYFYVFVGLWLGYVYLVGVVGVFVVFVVLGELYFYVVVFVDFDFVV